MLKRLLLPAWALPAAAWAHDGHGLDGSHWHATDVIGFVVLFVIGAIAAWWIGRH